MNVKFNAWDKFEKKMILWNELCVDDQLLADIILNSTRYIPLQFTGLYDINKQELYDGDSIKCVSNNLFSRGDTFFKNIMRGECAWWVEGTLMNLAEFLEYGDCTKQGNVYEGLKINL